MTLRQWLDAEIMRTAHLHPSKQRGTLAWLARKVGADKGLVSRWVRRLVTPRFAYRAKIYRLTRQMVAMADLERVER